MRHQKDNQVLDTISNQGTKDKPKIGRPKIGKDVRCQGCGETYYKKLSKLAKYGDFHPECFKKYLSENKVRPWSEDVYAKTSGENNHNFKGIMASCSSLHKRITYLKGRPEFCVDCGATKDEAILEWSNESGRYFDDPDDFQGRCQPCHKKHDKELGFPRKKSFDEKGRRIGITLSIPVEYRKNWRELQNA